MTYILVDVETDGPIPADYSMICFGAIIVDEQLDKTFYGQLKPISDQWLLKALEISGFTRQETLNFEDPETVMEHFRNWISEHSNKQPIFISDNNGFDWQFMNYYFHHFLEPVCKIRKEENGSESNHGRKISGSFFITSGNATKLL